MGPHNLSGALLKSDDTKRKEMENHGEGVEFIWDGISIYMKKTTAEM